MAAAPNSVVSLQKVLEKCEPTIRHIAVIVMRNGSAYLILSQSGWCFHNVDICWHISMRCLLQDAWVMPAIYKDLQNDVPYSCAKPMHQIHAKHGTCPG